MGIPRWLMAFLTSVFETEADRLDAAAYDADRFLAAAREGKIYTVQEMLKGELDIDSRLPDGSSALMAAAHGGHTAVVQILLAKGADVQVRNLHGDTALHRASLQGHVAVIDMLLNGGAKRNSLNNDGETPLTYAALGGSRQAYQLLVAAGAIEEQGLKVILAAAQGDCNALGDLLADGADPNFKTSGASVSALFAAALNRELQAAQLLVKNGADVDVTNKYGVTPLMHSAGKGYGDFVAFLIANGAAINIKNLDGATAFSRATEEGHTHIIELLKEASATFEC